MFADERQQQILEYVNRKKSISVQELSRLLYVSAATVRRDLSQMEQEGLLKRSHGGACSYGGRNAESALRVREQENLKQKKQIASLALDFIRSHSSIFMDSSTTSGAVIPMLRQFRYLTVITNGLKNALALSALPDITIYMTGGLVNTHSNSVVGSDAVGYAANMNTELALISCSGISLDSGVTEASPEQAKVKQMMLRHAKIKVLLCDHSKFGHAFLSKSCDLAQLDYILTDRKPPEEYIQAAAPSGCEILWENPEV